MKNRILIHPAGIGLLCAFIRSASGQPRSGRMLSQFTTAEGCDALNLLTTGAGNTGLGWYSLFSDTDRQLQYRCWRWNADPQHWEF